MADLDDFFAKRDKKKKAGKNKKFDTAEDLAKILGKKVEERKKMEEGKSQYVPDNDGQPPPVSGTSEKNSRNKYYSNCSGVVLSFEMFLQAQVNEDDEWMDAEEKEPDLTGLKIQELILDSEDEEERKEQEVGEGGETKSGEGVWGKKRTEKNVVDENQSSTIQQPPPSSDPSSAGGNNPEDSDSSTSKSIDVTREPEKTVESANPSSETPSEEAPSSGPAKFVPPHMRNRPAGSASSTPNPPPPSSRLESGAGTPAGAVKGAYVPPGRRAGATVASGMTVFLGNRFRIAVIEEI